MKNISLITMNNPGFIAAEKTVRDLLKINPDFNINIFYKGDGVTEFRLKACYINYFELDEIVLSSWSKSDAIIWYTATGIVIRKIAKLITSKLNDPAILVMNLDRTQVIPILSGHIGGANQLAKKLTEVNKNIVSFVTTATDSLGILALDNYAMDSGFDIVNINRLAKVSNAMINSDPINIITFEIIKDDLQKQGLNENNINYFDYNDDPSLVNKSFPTVIISPLIQDSVINKFENSFIIKVKPIALGIGLNRGTSIEELYDDFKSFIKEYDLSLNDIALIASFEAKRDEEAINLLAYKLKYDLKFFNEDEINNLPQEFSDSKAQEFFNIKGVAEPSAVLASNYKTLFIKKKVYKNTTIAAAF